VTHCDGHIMMGTVFEWSKVVFN